MVQGGELAAVFLDLLVELGDPLLDLFVQRFVLFSEVVDLSLQLGFLAFEKFDLLLQRFDLLVFFLEG